MVMQMKSFGTTGARRETGYNGRRIQKTEGHNDEIKKKK
jgi:hypothetical protein